jgi:hypothetical protein
MIIIRLEWVLYVWWFRAYSAGVTVFVKCLIVQPKWRNISYLFQLILGRKKYIMNEVRYLPNNLDSNIVCERKRKMSDGENRGEY